MRSTVRLVAATAVLGLLVAGCADTGTTSSGEGETVDLTGGTWELEEGTTPDGPLTAPEGSRITLEIDAEGEFGGTAACNSYGGTLTIDGSSVDLGAFAITEMACEPPLMQAEQQYVSALQAIDSASRSGDRLTLTGPDLGLRFRLQPPVEDVALVGTTWVLDTLFEDTGPNSAATSVQGEPTLEFGEDGTITGDTGCRSFTGEYTTDGDAVQVLDLDPDGLDCAADLTSQDEHVFEVLAPGFTTSIDGRRLTLTGEEDQGLGYRAADAAG